MKPQGKQLAQASDSGGLKLQSVGYSPYSLSSPSVTFLISNVRASSITQTSALIDWDLTDYGNGQVEYGMSSTRLNMRNIAEVSLNYKSHQQPLKGLTAGTTYFYRVRSRNATGIRATSNIFSFTTPSAMAPAPVPVPIAGFRITNLRSSEISPDSAVIDWDLNEFGTGQIEYGLASNSLTMKNIAEITLNYQSHQQPIQGLNAGTKYFYRAVSRNAAGATTTSNVLSFTTAGAVGAPSPNPAPVPTSGDWQVTYAPPAMPGARIIRIPADVPLTDWPAYNGHCAGKVYRIELPTNQDAIITQSSSIPLNKPLQIIGGRNVRVIGLEFQFQVQAGCNNGGYLKVPGGIALGIQQAGTTFIEGLKMDLNGHTADCIVSTNDAGLSEAQALANRNVVVQNSACRGSVGTHPGSAGGDYLHADFFQNQGSANADYDPINRVVFENISQLTRASGVVLDGRINEAIAINYEFALDTRFPDTFFVLTPLWMTGNKVLFKNIYTDFDSDHPITGNGPSTVRVESEGIYYSYADNGIIKFSPEIHRGVPAQAFAPWDKIGLSYQSPHP